MKENHAPAEIPGHRGGLSPGPCKKAAPKGYGQRGPKRSPEEETKRKNEGKPRASRDAGTASLLARAGARQQRNVHVPAEIGTPLARDLRASGVAVARPDSAARAWNFRALRRFGFDGAALVFCCPAVSPQFAAGSFSAKTPASRGSSLGFADFAPDWL